MKTIESFSGDYAFLSNFYTGGGPLLRVRVHVLIGHKFVPVPSVEHAYQAYKSPYADERRWIIDAETPSEAKRRQRDLGTILVNWHELKVPIMLGLLFEKFQQDTFRQWLDKTGSATLVEGNHWHDNFWGHCTCTGDTCPKRKTRRGENMLGRLLMHIRGS